MPIKNVQTGETEARMFYIAYTLDNAPAGTSADVFFQWRARAPASVWLHLGALGPRRIQNAG
jgi:carboxypeptidase C (cathepsin A)